MNDVNKQEMVEQIDVPMFYHFFPFYKRNKLDVVTPKAQRAADGLIRFYQDLFGELPESFRIFTYYGIANGTEIQWVRFQTGDTSQTFAVRNGDFDRWMDAVLDLKDPNWMVSDNGCADMHSRDLKTNVAKATIELPLSFFNISHDKDLMDDLYDGDFQVLGSTLGRLKDFMINKMKEATKETNYLVNCKAKRDHDLYLVFKALPGLKHLGVSLEKVNPIFADETGVSLGDNPASYREWGTEPRKIENAVKRIYNAGKQINREIDKARAFVTQNPIILKEFDQWVKTNLFAAAHFTKLVYGFNGEDCPDLVNLHANKIIRALTHKGGNIGLDLNSWITWEYTQGEIPKRSEDPDVDFIGTLHKKYTESFITALYSFLLHSSNPFIRPYDYREVADPNDGIAIGTVRLAR